MLFRGKGKKKLEGVLYKDANELVGRYLRWLQTLDIASSKRLILFSHDIGLQIEVLRHSVCRFLSLPSELGCLEYKDISDAFVDELNRSIIIHDEYKSDSGASHFVQSCIIYMTYLRNEVENGD